MKMLQDQILKIWKKMLDTKMDQLDRMEELEPACAAALPPFLQPAASDLSTAPAGSNVNVQPAHAAGGGPPSSDRRGRWHCKERQMSEHARLGAAG